MSEREHLENVGVDGRIILKIDIQVEDCEGWTELTWLRVRTGGGFW